jgi:mannose-6-phosphate isomerase-like protein (cupin superfamily)
MFKPLLIAALAAMATPSSAQETALPYATAAQIAAARAKAAAAIQPGHGSANTPIMALGDLAAKLEVHVGPNFANAHPQQAEMFQVLDGGGTLTTGGTLVGSGVGSSIKGGAQRHIAAGDVFIVPPGVNHWFGAVDGQLVMISVMLPKVP